MKIITAAASVATAIILPLRIPAIMSLIEAWVNQRRQKEALEVEVQQRLAAETDLRKLKDTLELRVRDRTSELSQANSALSLYETIFTTSAWGVAIVDSVRGLIQLANPAFARMHGYAPGELIGMRVADTFAPESAAKIPQLIDIINASDHLMYESVHIRKDNTRFPCLTDVTLVRDPQGLPLYRFGYFQDISSQKRAEEDSRNVVTHARCILWRAMVTGLDDWQKYERGASKFSWDLKVQDEIAAQNFQPLDVPPGGTYSQAWLASRHPEDARLNDEISSKAFVKGSPTYTHTFRCTARFGGTLWIREAVAILPISPGQWQCTGVCVDVTDEHRLSEQLRQQAELLELSHDAIIVRTETGEILFWNSGAEALYGWQRDEVIGKNIRDILSAQAPPDEFAKSLADHGYWSGRLHHAGQDGRQIVVDSRHLRVNRGDGQQVVLETNHDITSWQQADAFTATLR